MIAVHTAEHPTATEWNEVIELTTQSPVKFAGSLVYTEGGSPSALQRKQLRDALVQSGSEKQLTAVLTESIVARTAITALNLFLGGTVKPFPPNEIEEALRYINTPSSLWKTMQDNLKEMKHALGIMT